MTTRKSITALAFALALGLGLVGSAMAGDTDLYDRVKHGYAESQGVKIHYASLGEGPLVVMIHGFPDFWYSWRHQMEALSDRFLVRSRSAATTRVTNPKASRTTTSACSSATSRHDPPSGATRRRLSDTTGRRSRGSSRSTCRR